MLAQHNEVGKGFFYDLARLQEATFVLVFTVNT